MVAISAWILAAAAVAAYFWGGGEYAQSYHPWESFHYFLGSKHHRELGYSRLYACTAVATSERGPGMKREVQTRQVAQPRYECPRAGRSRAGGLLDMQVSLHALAVGRLQAGCPLLPQLKRA